ncbi:MAG: hypothetical protein L6Q54_08215 [Leptospiraceae bacterium]|nr:hypothetical protein [Leptospiraceae bacterium]MCK6381219.1 hypothetical protein [Leptospiraceae bacterium]NUM40742.1 hypothetical protein [Leptospiraceae bacterium]
MQKTIIVLLLCIIHINIFANQDSTKATQLVKSANGIKENEYFLTAINSSVSNLGDENDKKLFKRCIQHHIESSILYLQFEVGKSYTEVRHTQELIIVLYQSLLNKNIEFLKEEFSRLGKYAVQTGNKKALFYMRLGMRDLAVGEQKILSAKNTRPYLYLLKIKDMVEALKSLKQSGKYIVLLALMYESDYPVDAELTKFEEIKHEINRAMFSKKEKFNKIHHDNNFLTLSGENMLRDIWDKPEIHELATPLENIDRAYQRRDPPIPSPEKKP